VKANIEEVEICSLQEQILVLSEEMGRMKKKALED